MPIPFGAELRGRRSNSFGCEPSVTLDEQVELLSLIGDVTLKDGEPLVHAHAVIGKKDGTAHGGHLLKAKVRQHVKLF